MPTKPYQLLREETLKTEKGMVNNTFVRFIVPADSVFSLFCRSLGFRDPKDNTKCHYVIYDKEEKHLEMFKHILTWNAFTDDAITYDNFKNHVDVGADKLGIEIKKYRINTVLGNIIRHAVVDFHQSWNIFKNNKFTFIKIDMVKENEKFLEMLGDLPVLKKEKSQFVKVDINDNSEEYVEAINNILHKLWLGSIRTYPSIVEISDENNNSIEDYAGKLYSKLNPSFCILPWMHVQYKPSGQSKPCCRYDNNQEDRDFQEYLKNPTVQHDNLSELFLDRAKNLIIQKSSIEETFNSEYWNKARELTIKNKPISGCHKCYAEEKTDGEISLSMRLGSSILYNDGFIHKKPKFEKPSLEFLEVGFGNYCNLACLSCNSSLSTTWHDNEVALNKTASQGIKRTIFPKLDNIRFDLADDTLKTLKLVKFTGGEPMINPEFVKFIGLICERGHPENINLEIYTNCSYIPSPKLLENLVKFKNIQLNLSIDAFGSVNDYVRYGSTWEGDAKQTVSRAIDFWLDQGVNNKGLTIIMSTTLSILNVFEVPKLMSWWMKKFKDSGNKVIVHRTEALPTEYEGFFKLQMAFDPSYIGVNILPQSYYNEVVAWCDEYENNFSKEYPDLEFVPESISASLSKLRNTIKRSKGDAKNAQLLLEYLEKMDKIRNNSAEYSIPKVITKVKEYLLTQDILQQN